MDINELKKLGAKALCDSLEICQKSFEKGAAYGEKLDFHSAIKEFTVVIDLFHDLIKLTKELDLPPEIARQVAILISELTWKSYLGHSVAYVKIGEKGKGTLDMMMAEKLKTALPSTLQNETPATLFETINSKPAQSTNSSSDLELKDFEYARIGYGIEIKKYIGTATSVNIPSRIDNLNVTIIGKGAFAECKSLISIQIPNSVITICDKAFKDCESLTSIQIPNSVTSIGGRAFCACTSLTSIQIPNSVTTIDREAFRACESLTSVQIPNSVKTIGDWAFRECKSLTSIQISESTILGEDVFKDCNTSLQILRTPNTKKASEVKTSVAGTGCIVPSVIFVYGVYWLTKSIGNFLFG